LKKADLKNLKYWICEDSTECEVIIMSGRYSGLTLFILPPEFSRLVGPVSDVEARQWAVRLMDYGQSSTLDPATLAQGETLDELLLPLKEYTDRHEKSFDEILDVLEKMEGVGLSIGNRYALAGDLIDTCLNPEKLVTPKFAAKRAISNSRYKTAIGIVESKYEYEPVIQLLVDLGVEREEAEERVWIFESMRDIGKMAKPE